MKTSAAGIDLIKSFEGYHQKLPNGDCAAYLCPAGKPTIGWGCTEGVKLGMTWTRKQAEAALARELAKAEAAVLRHATVELNQHQFDALVSFVYNIGEAGFASSTALKKLNRRDWKGAAAALRLWDKATDPKTGRKVRLPGLVDRRAREATLFLTPPAAEKDEGPSMPQQVSESVPPAPAPLKEGVAAVVGGTGVSAGLPASPVIPAPPAAASESIANLSLWQQITMTAKGLGEWSVEHWPWLLGVVATYAALAWLSKRRAA